MLSLTLAAGVMLVMMPIAAFTATTFTAQTKPRTIAITRNAVHTGHLIDRAVTWSKLQAKAVVVNVNAAAATGSSAADPALVGGTIIGWRSAGNQDQLIDNMVLNGDGSITITLAAAATATNNFVVVTIGAVGNF